MLDVVIDIKGSKVKFWLRLSWKNLCRCLLYLLKSLLPSQLTLIKQNGCVIVCAICQIALKNRLFRWIIEKKSLICLRIACISSVYLIMDSLSQWCREKGNKQSSGSWSKTIAEKAFYNLAKSSDPKLVSIFPISKISLIGLIELSEATIIIRGCVILNRPEAEPIVAHTFRQLIALLTFPKLFAKMQITSTKRKNKHAWSIS